MTLMIAPLDERARAYDRMAHALDHLGDTWRDWPDLASVAAAMNLSPSHFQREFTRWAGVSPKQFQAALAHGEAGELLRDGASVLDAALETGLSGPDLILGKAPTPFGLGAWLIGPRGLVALGFIDEGAPKRTGFEHQGVGEAQAFADLAARYPGANIRHDDAEAERFARKVFESGEPMPVALYGTPFRRQVWRALLEIPTGTTKTYGQLAKVAGSPKAARAVGAAVGANPISWFIPCHRTCPFFHVADDPAFRCPFRLGRTPRLALEGNTGFCT